jgi:predicted dehydrogenase
MKLALLGTDDDVLELARAATAGGHAIVWLGDARPVDAAALGQIAPGLAVAADWEALLGQGIADAVIVGTGTSPESVRAEQLKRLVNDAVPLLVVHPTGSSVLPYYELDMGRTEIHSVLRHYNPVIGAPAVVELAALVQSGDEEIGTVQQVVCQRFAVDCGRVAVLRHLARDAELLRTVADEIRTVSAVGPKSTDESYASLQTQMTSAGRATLRWSVTPSTSSHSYVEVTLVGERGTRTVSLPPADWDAPRAAVDALVAAVPANGSHKSDAASTWRDATAAMEIVDTIGLSLDKGRNLEVHPQRLTQELAFRGAMSAFGCGLLLLGMMVLFVAGVMGDVVGLQLFKLWPWALLTVLTLFLLLQIVPWLATKRSPSAPGDATSDSERR